MKLSVHVANRNVCILCFSRS